MKTWSPRISIPSDVGSYERILNSETDIAQLSRHGRDNEHTIMVAIIAWVSLLGDSPLEHKPNRVINKFVNLLLSRYKETCALFSDLSDCVSRETYHDHTDQTLLTEGYTEEFKKTPIFREYLEFRRSKDPRLLRFILSFLEFGRKVGYIDAELDAKALRLWQEVEDRLKTTELPSYIGSLKSIVHWMFEKGWSEDEFLPKHGSGSVAERGVTGVGEKCVRMTLDPKVAYMYQRRDEESLCFPTPTGAVMPNKGVKFSTARLRFVPKDLKKTRSIAMEPIDFQWAQQGVRLWYERWLAEGPLKHHVFLKDQTRNQILAWHGSITSNSATIDLSSASDSVNLDLVKAIFPARVLKHLLATRSRYIELPSGGEPVSVKKFAPMGSALCFPVQCTIFSAVVLLVSIAELYRRNIWEGDTIEDLSLDHAFLAVSARPLGDRPLQRFFVYGDDIICDKQIVSNTIRTLVECGFTVNEDKSYIGDVAYRESCGIHCFNGYDVTPYTLKIRPLSPRMSLKASVGVVDAANRAGRYGYKNLYSCLVNVALRYPIEKVKKQNGLNPILFVPLDSEETYAIRTNEPRNDHLISREFHGGLEVVSELSDEELDRLGETVFSVSEKVYGPYQPIRLRHSTDCMAFCQNQRPRSTPSHVALQRDEVQSIVVGPAERVKASRKFDAYYHTQWWRTRYSSLSYTDVESVAAKADTKGVRVRRRWTAA